MRNILRTISVLALVFLLSGAAFAQNNLKAKWDDLVKALDNDPGISGDTKNALKAFGEALVEDKGEAIPPGELGAKVDEWFSNEKRVSAADRLFGTSEKRGLLERLSIYGDFRYRFQADVKPDTWNNPAAGEEHDERVQQSARLRLGFVYNIEDDLLDFGARLTTGPVGEANSAEAGFDGDFPKIDVNWDRIYLHYTPFSQDRPFDMWGLADMTTDFYIGKFDHKWLFLAGCQVWDDDVQPLGFGGLFRWNNFGCGLIDEVRASLGFYQLTEEQFNEDATMFVAQVGVIKGFEYAGHKFKVTLASAIYDINDPDDDMDRSSVLWHDPRLGLDNGVTPPSPNQTNYISEFQILHNLFQLDFDGFEILGKQRPIKFIFEHVHNADGHNDPNFPRHSSRDVNDGYNFIITMGELEKKCDWRIGYGYFNFERDSLFTIVSGNDFGRQSDFIGNVVWLDYKLLDRVSARVWYAWWQERIDDLNAAEDDHVQGRFRLELLVEF
ncbi:MAG: putative porin [Planctomycetota bacterium]